jgi:hypothetical protein
MSMRHALYAHRPNAHAKFDSICPITRPKSEVSDLRGTTDPRGLLKSGRTVAELRNGQLGGPNLARCSISSTLSDELRTALTLEERLAEHSLDSASARAISDALAVLCEKHHATCPACQSLAPTGVKRAAEPLAHGVCTTPVFIGVPDASPTTVLRLPCDSNIVQVGA